MPDFSTIEDSLFIPVLGRIYVSEVYPDILLDKKALELKDKIPESIDRWGNQSQYTLMANAVRSVNIDRYIRDFMHRNTKGVIVQLHCGLETTFQRNDNNHTQWYEVDLPEVIDYRMKILGGSPRDTHIVADIFAESWLKAIRAKHPDEPLLVSASGFLYYYTEEAVLSFFEMLKHYGPIEVIFDTVNKTSMQHMTNYIKQANHDEAPSLFYLNNTTHFADTIGATILDEAPYYAHICKKEFSFHTANAMRISDRLKNIKMLHLRLN